jgi:hypothetical protein
MKANVRAVLGYPGRAEVHLAIERGELDGECGSKEGMPESWFTENKIDIVVRILEAKSPKCRRAYRGPANSSKAGRISTCCGC